MKVDVRDALARGHGVRAFTQGPWADGDAADAAGQRPVRGPKDASPEDWPKSMDAVKVKALAPVYPFWMHIDNGTCCIGRQLEKRIVKNYDKKLKLKWWSNPYAFSFEKVEWYLNTDKFIHQSRAILIIL